MDIEEITSHTERVVITYTTRAIRSRHLRHAPATQRVRCVVEVSIDIVRAARMLGPRACRSASGIERRGFVAVRRVSDPVEIATTYRHEDTDTPSDPPSDPLANGTHEPEPSHEPVYLPSPSTNTAQ